MLRFWPALPLLVAMGCAHATDPIPAYPPMPVAQALKILADRAQAIRTVSAQASLTLTHGNGQTIQLDAALVMQPPERARLRAYKFGQAVFDMTLTPDGMWLASPRGDRRNMSLAAGTNAGDLTRQWMRLLIGSFENPSAADDAITGELVLSEMRGNVQVVCRIDRKTLTPREYEMRDANGHKRFTLKLDRYSTINGIAWPLRLEAISDRGKVLIELHDVEINGEIPADAFRPPARAEKLP